MKILKKYISPILTVFVLVLFAIYLYKNPEILIRLKDTNPFFVLVIMVLYLFIFFLEGLFILVTLKIFNKKMSPIEGWYIATFSRIGNYLLPMRAGAVFRAVYLKKKYNFDYSNFLATLYSYYIVFFLTNAVIILALLLFKAVVLNEIYMTLILFSSALIGGMVVLIFFRVSFKNIFKNSTGIIRGFTSFFDKFFGGWDLIVKSGNLFTKLILLAFANIFVNILVIYIEFISIGKVGEIIDVILYTCISGISLFISITPGSLGIREGVLLLTSNSLGLTNSEIMELAFLDRGIIFLLLLICLSVILIFFRKINLKEVFFGKRNDI